MLYIQKMPYQLFDCGIRTRCAPLNPCGVPLSNPHVRAAAVWYNQQYTTPSTAGDRWVCDAACKYVDYRAPRCCLPKKQYTVYHPHKSCCDEEYGYGHH